MIFCLNNFQKQMTGGDNICFYKTDELKIIKRRGSLIDTWGTLECNGLILFKLTL